LLDHRASCHCRLLPVQEERLGAEQVALVKILQTHGVVVRGGAEHGRKLVDALLVCRTLLLAENLPPTVLVLLAYVLHRLRPGCSTFGLKGLVCKQDWKQQDALDMQKAWRQEYVEEERKD